VPGDPQEPETPRPARAPRGRKAAPAKAAAPAAAAAAEATPTQAISDATPPAKAEPATSPAKAEPAAPQAKAEPAAPQAKAQPTAPPAKAQPTAPHAKAQPTAPHAKAQPTAPHAKAQPATSPAKAEPTARTAEQANAQQEVAATEAPLIPAQPTKARAKSTPAKRTPRKRADAQLLTPKSPDGLDQPHPEEPAPSTRAADEAATAAQLAPTPEPPTPTEKTPDQTTEERTPIFTELAAERTHHSPTPAPETRTEAWAQLIADPGHTPELLALAAVQTIGPRAQHWARRTRESYPTATDRGLARLATRQFTRFGSLTSVFGAVAGSYAPIALLGAAALTHAELILHLAAAYGLDPTDEERATDLLVLTRVHPSRSDAESALHAAKQPAYEDSTKLSDAAWRLGRMAAAQSGGWAAVRLVNRYFPGTSLLVAALTSSSAAETVANRANAYFSQANQESGSRV
jgi:hypothetical protein